MPPRLSRQLTDLAEQQGRSPDELMLESLMEAAGEGEQITVKLSPDFSRHLYQVRKRAGLDQNAFGVACLEHYLAKVKLDEVMGFE